MSNFIIRDAVATDLPVIHDLVRELAIFENAEPLFTATLADYEADFAAGIFQAIVIERDGEVAGMALYYMTYSTWKGRMLYLEDFVVREHLRQHGIGQLLFDAVKERARALGCRLLKWQVLDWNASAIAFYKKNGATIDTDWWTGRLVL